MTRIGSTIGGGTSGTVRRTLRSVNSHNVFSRRTINGRSRGRQVELGGVAALVPAEVRRIEEVPQKQDHLPVSTILTFVPAMAL